MTYHKSGRANEMWEEVVVGVCPRSAHHTAHHATCIRSWSGNIQQSSLVFQEMAEQQAACIDGFWAV